MKIAILGTYFKKLKDAQKYAKEKQRLFRSRFLILQNDDGFLVVAERQLGITRLLTSTLE